MEGANREGQDQGGAAAGGAGEGLGCAGEYLLLTLNNGLVLPHLQYCIMVWRDFEGEGNKTLCGALLKLQKRLVGLIADKHMDPLFARFAVLKVGDFYRQQLRVHTRQF